MRPDSELANLAYRQLRREHDAKIPASDVGELEYHVGNCPLLEHASNRLDPTSDAPTLAEEAKVVYAKAKYTGVREHRREFVRKRREWVRKARISFHREDLERDPYRSPADEYQSDLSTSDRADTADGGER